MSGETLTSGTASTSANDWRYIRFVNEGSTTDITSITLEYTCEGLTASDDVDLTKDMKLEWSGDFTCTAETEHFVGDSEHALRIAKGESATDNTARIGFSFANTFTVGDIKDSVIEFDYYFGGKNGKGYPQFALLNQKLNAIKTVTTQGSSYVTENTETSWAHICVPVSAALSTSSTDTDVVAGIRFVDYNVAGYIVIDNLRINTQVA